MSKSWSSVRREVLKRDEYTCQDCGAVVGTHSNPHVKNAEVHHKTPRAEDGADTPENLITLCADCHAERNPPIDGRDGRGQFASKYTDEDFLDAVGASGGAAGTTEIADAVGCPQRTAYHRLDELRDAGDVSSRKVGGSILWLLADADD